jgi:ABC-type multidrug transport system ATPase subunit
VEDVRELCSQMAIIDHGRVVLSGAPARVLEEVRGRIWRRAVPKAELEDFRRQYEVISARLVGGNPVVHVYSELPPGEEFEEVEADLEDVYFQQLHARRDAAPRA